MARKLRLTKAGLSERLRFLSRRPRTYGYNDSTHYYAPDDGNDMALTAKEAEALHPRGNDYPQHSPYSEAIIDGPSLIGPRNLPQLPTALDQGAAPIYIRRRTRALNDGAVWFGSGTGITGRQAIDAATDPGAMYIPHQRIPRVPITVTAFRRTVDNTSTIPSRGIAAPVKSV